MNTLQWIGDPIIEAGVTERRFDLQRESGIVPGILWTPTEYDHPVPLVLMGHGGSGHKRSDRQLMLAQRLATVFQLATATIDGPFHGDRVSEPLDHLQHQARTISMGVEKVTDAMVDDWANTLEALSQLHDIEANRIAYMGFSMGTRFGLPYVAATGNRLRCAVFGKNGMRQTSGMVNMAPRFERDAPTIKIPVLYHVQWDDELFPRDGQFELFDLIGTHDKRLIAFPGSHKTSTPEAMEVWCAFVARHLID